MENSGRFKKGNIPWNKGKKLPEEKKGINHHNYGNKYGLGRKVTEEEKLKTASIHYGNKYALGYKLSEKAKARLSELGKLRTGKKNNRWGAKLTEKHIQILRESRKNQKFPLEDSKPEKMMQIALSLQGIKYERQKLFRIGKSYHPVDLFIEPNICVEVDGKHWHIEIKDIKRDLLINQTLNIKGYHVIRIRENDILKNANACAENIINLIKQCTFSYISNFYLRREKNE